MTYALCSDLHCHPWSQFAKTNEDGINSRLQHLMDEISRMASMAANEGCKNVYIAGDVFHVRGQIKPSVLNPVKRLMQECAEDLGLHFIIMCGNHDLEGRNSKWVSSAVSSLECNAIKVVHEQTYFEDDNVLMIPWVNTKDELYDVLESVVQSGGDMSDTDLILHTGINGVLMGIPDNGWAPEELGQFGFKRVFSGHYHAHKVFNAPMPIVSIGSMTHQTWSDVGTKAGWIIVEDDSFDFHENYAPKFIDFDPEADMKTYRGNYVRVKGIELDEADIRTLRGALEEAGAEGVVVHAVPKVKVISRTGSKASGSVTIEGSVADWIDTAEIENAEAVQAEALDVLSEVRAA